MKCFLMTEVLDVRDCQSSVSVSVSSVCELVDVVVESVEGESGLAGVRAVLRALAGLDHHHVLVEGLSVLAAELDPDGPGVLGAAAASVHAGAAEPRTILLQAGAAGVRELHRHHRLLGAVAFLSFLQAGVWRLAAGPDLTDAALLHQFAFSVIIGDSGGDSSTTASGALGPAGGLHDALLHLMRSESR